MPNIKKSEKTEKRAKFSRVILLAYPDNPVGTIYFKIFNKNKVQITCVILEKKTNRLNWNRFKQKLKKDGLIASILRILQINILFFSHQQIVQLARRNGVRIYFVEKFNSLQCANLLSYLNADLLAIASAPLLKEFIFSNAKYGCLNAHPGWLPKYRGLGANSYAVQNGDNPGVTVHFLDSGIDTGKIIIREKIKIMPKDTIAKINDRAVIRGAELMADIIHQILNNQLELPIINEPIGHHYRTMPYTQVKKLNRILRRMTKHEI